MSLGHVKMPSVDLRKVQLIQLEMLLVIDEICRKNNINYYMVGGTLLGAIRHQGYIPWDDDADIAMLRDDYERFFEICKKELDISKFYLQDHRNTEEYRWGYGKLRRKNTTFIRAGQEHFSYESGIFIDVFPVDYVPENKYLRYIHSLACFVVRKLLWSAAGAKCEKKWYKRYSYKILALIPKKVDFFFYDMIKYWSNKKKSLYVRTLTFPIPSNQGNPALAKWVTTTQETFFEGYKLFAPIDYYSYLKFKFDDYMQIPKEAQRCGHEFSSYQLLKDDEIMEEPRK